MCLCVFVYMYVCDRVNEFSSLAITLFFYKVSKFTGDTNIDFVKYLGVFIDKHEVEKGRRKSAGVDNQVFCRQENIQLIYSDRL